MGMEISRVTGGEGEAVGRTTDALPRSQTRDADARGDARTREKPSTSAGHRRRPGPGRRPLDPRSAGRQKWTDSASAAASIGDLPPLGEEASPPAAVSVISLSFGWTTAVPAGDPGLEPDRPRCMGDGPALLSGFRALSFPPFGISVGIRSLLSPVRHLSTCASAGPFRRWCEARPPRRPAARSSG